MSDPAKILKTAREKKGLTQEGLAAELKMSHRILQRYEAGEWPKFNNENIKKIDEFLGTNICDLIYAKDVPHETPNKTQENTPLSETTIANLVESNKMLAEANLNYSIANKTLAENTRELISSINKKISGAPTIENDYAKNQLAMAALLGNVQSVLFEVATGKRYKNKQEVEDQLYKGDREIRKRVLVKDSQI